MRLKSVVLGALIISASMSAVAKQAEPNRCPSIDAIKTVPMNKAVKDSYLGWIAYSTVNSKYDTQDEWTMITFSGLTSTDDEAGAILAANDHLTSINTVQGPQQDASRWLCLYGIDDGDGPQLVGYAINPPHVEIASLIRHGA